MKKNTISNLTKISISLSIGIYTFFSLSNSNVKAQNNNNQIIQNIGNGKVNWTNNIISVTGSGTAQTSTNIAQARLLAQRAAISDAYRQLAETIHGVQIDSETSVKDFIVESDIIKTKVNGFIKGARRGEMRVMPDGAVEYDLYVSMYGANGLSSALDFGNYLNNQKKNKQQSLKKLHNQFSQNINNKVAFLPSKNMNFFTFNINPTPDMNNCLQCHSPHKVPESLKQDNNINQEQKVSEENKDNNSITGIIIDASELGLVPSMAPAIYSSDLNQLYIGNWEIDPDYVINNGIIGYFGSIEEAKSDSRVGNNPLIIKAENLKGFNDLIVNKTIANQIMEKDKLYNFLEKYAVSVVMQF